MSNKRSYSRNAPKKSPRPSIVILVEGEVTEPECLKALMGALRVPSDLVDIRKAEHSDADGIVGEAKELLLTSKRKKSTPKIDEIWVIADTESEHSNGSPENVLHAINRSGDDVRLVLDSPGIEYWFLLHFVNTTRNFPSVADVIAQLQNHWPEYSKRKDTLNWGLLVKKTPNAMKNAEQVRKYREDSQSNRPIADLDVLVAKLNGMGKFDVFDLSTKEKNPVHLPTREDLFSWKWTHKLR
ncbi:MAG: RloB family protein [Coriobacteriales bacterium]|nr:RloB family protein [Coriobacteriales bacterium]